MYERIDTPMPMSPDCGTQNICCASRAPAMCSACCGPGTLVITAEPLDENMSSTCFWIARGKNPTVPRMPIDSAA